MLIESLQSFLASVGPFFILLGILIFVHELGHFAVAKYFGVRVETFSLGFGKKIFSYKRGDTTYCLSLIPLGGYVKMYGDDPTATVPENERKYAFLHKPISQRFAIVLAGPLMNLFFAIFVFTLIVGVGEEVPGPYVGDIAADSKAYAAGLRPGDKVIQVDGVDTPTWAKMQKQIETAGGKVVTLRIERKGESQPLQLEAPVAFGANDNIFSSSREVGQIPGLTQESRWTIVGVNDPKSPAATAGVPSLSLLVSVNGQKVTFWRDIQGAILATTKPESKTLALQIRDIDKAEKPENLRTIEVPLPEGWQNAPDIASTLGLENAELYIYQVKTDSPADKAGIQAKDKVVSVNGQNVKAWSDVLGQVKGFDAEKEALNFVIQRGGETLDIKVKPEMTTLMTNKGQEEHRYTIGIISGYSPIGPEPVFYRISNPVEMVKQGLKDTAYWTEFVVMSLVRLVQGEVSAKNIGGVITIGRVASHSFAAGFSSFLKMMGLISINLFLLNLLPIPILDGGHLVFYAIEGLRGAPLSMRKMEIAQQVGLMLLMFLMAFAFFNDITNLFSSRW